MKPHARPLTVIVLATLAGAPLEPAPAVAQTSPAATHRATNYGIEISRETTVLTSPLLPDGMVDYAQAINAETSKGVTPQNNAACLLARIVRAGEDRWLKMPEEVLSRMGVATTAPKIVWIDAPDALDARMDEQDAYGRPWKRAQSPDLAAWLERNDAALKLFVEASHKPRWWIPLRSDSKGFMLEGGSTGFWSVARSTAAAMWARSMLKLGEGDEQGAWDDLAACARIAGVVSTSEDLIGKLVAGGLQTGMLHAMCGLIEHGELRPAVLQQMAALLEEQPTLPDRGAQILQSQRYELLMQVAYIARGMQEALDENEQGLKDRLQAAGLLLPDWNRILRTTNQLCDMLQSDETRMSADERQAHRATIAARLAELAKIKRDSHSEMRADATMDTAWLFPLAGETQEAYSDRVGAVIFMTGLTSGDRMRDRFAECNDALTWTRVAIALVRHRQEHGSYPADLNALVPEFLAAPPQSQAPHPVRYERTTTGFVLTNDAVPAANPKSVGVITIRRDR